MPIIGTRSACANALPAASPTRMPVNSPGPTSTAMQPSLASSMSAWRHTNSIAGVRISAWRVPRATSNVAITPSWPPIATPTCSVAVSMPRISMAAQHRTLHRVGRSGPSAGPRGPTACISISRVPASAKSSPTCRRLVDGSSAVRRHRPRRRRVVVIVDVARAAPRDGRRAPAPATSPHSTSTMPSNSASSWQRQFVDVGRACRAGTGRRGAACSRSRQRIAVHERERRRRDRLGHAERAPETLRERRLAGAHLAGQHDHVAGARDTGDRGRDGVGRR